MRTILVTGGAGFLGSHLCKLLLEHNGNKVICLDNFFTGKIDNLRDLESNPNFKIVSHDITDPLIGKISEHVDEIYNLACPASPIHYQFDPIETIKSNTVGVVNVLEFARVNGAKILQASTSEIYGDPEVHPQVESYNGNVNTLGPRACYDEGKRVAETLFMDYHRKYNLDIRIVRIFNTYGTNMARDDGRVVSNFIIQALNNKPITIYGDGNQTRSFCYVSDLVEGLYLTMTSGEIMPINLGNPDEFTIKDLAEKVIEITGSSSEIVYRELPIDDPKQRQPDIGRAKTVLNWSPKVNLNDGLKITIPYFDN
ncbi:SDR family oxidoreductase [Candidatus Woesearchaeota archaeon]|jgi:UDP-glucuronate decarboxylase|nr:SDR family oxidoreductase [Candidatus Woesearchaeota archaeon]